MVPPSSLSKKTLVVIRHAHRDKEEGREADNGLSKRGKRQAERIIPFFRKRFDDSSALLLSSAKLRCMETLLPLGVELMTEVKVSPLLMEQEKSTRDLQMRVGAFLDWWKIEAPALTVVCSHGDWIPLFIHRTFKVAVDLKKGGWIEVELNLGEPRLRWIVQTL